MPFYKNGRFRKIVTTGILNQNNFRDNLKERIPSILKEAAKGMWKHYSKYRLTLEKEAAEH